MHRISFAIDKEFELCASQLASSESYLPVGRTEETPTVPTFIAITVLPLFSIYTLVPRLLLAKYVLIARPNIRSGSTCPCTGSIQRINAN
jgi:hypothetical protein